MNRSTSTPPFARITRCDATLSTSFVISTNPETLLFCERQNQRQGARRIASALLPWHDAITDVTQAVIRQVGRSRSPTKADASRKFAVPDPPLKPGKSIGERSVGQRDRRPFRVAVVQSRKKGTDIDIDPLEFLGSCVGTPRAIRRPATCKRGGITRNVHCARTNEPHHSESVVRRKISRVAANRTTYALSRRKHRQRQRRTARHQTERSRNLRTASERLRCPA